MASLGNLQVILELEDGNFTTRVVRAGQALQNLQGQANVAVTAVQNVTNKMSGGIGHIAGWTIALGEAGHAAETLNTIFGSWIEKIVSVNQHIENTTALLAGFSNAATQVDRLKEGLQTVNTIMDMSTKAPFSFDALQNTFVKMKTAGVDPLNGSMKSLTDAVAAFGGDDTRLNRAAYAIQEMAGRGVISLSNLRRQLGQDIPGAVQAMADSMHMSVEQLDQEVTKGTLDSKNAIAQMLDQFDRLYGGAAVARMQTFTGQVAQLETQFMRLAQAAGGTEANMDPNQSFYRSLVDGMREVNRAFASPEMTAAAIKINEALKSITDSAKGLIQYLPALANNIELIGHAMEALAVVIGGKLLMMLGGSLISVLGQGITGFKVLAETIPLLVSAIPAAVTWISRLALSLGGMAVDALEPITILAAATTGLGEGLAVAGAAFTAVAIPVGVAVAAVWGLSNLLKDIPGRAEVAGTALKRLRQGDVTQTNQAESTKELTDLRAKSDLYQKTIEDLRRSMARTGRVPFAATNDVGGALGDTGVDLSKRLDDLRRLSPDAQKEEFKKLLDDLVEKKNYLDAKIQQFSQQLKAAPAKLLQQTTRDYAQQILDSAQTDVQPVIRKFEENQAKYREMRKDAEPGDHDFSNAITSAENSNSASRYEGELSVLQSYMDREKQAIASALQTQNTTEAANHKEALDELVDYYNKRKKQIDEAVAREGLVVILNGAKDYEKQKKSAETDISNSVARLAQLRDQLSQMQEGASGSATAVSKLMAELGDNGKYSQLGGPEGELIKILIDLKGQIDSTTESIKQFKQETAADHQIDLGVDKSTAELNGYLLKLTDPSMPEAQQKFVLFQNQMEESLQKFVTAAMSGATDVLSFVSALSAISAEADKVAKAIDNMKSSIALGQLETLAKQAHNSFVNSLPPAERAKQQAADFAAALKKSRDEIANDPNRSAEEKANASKLADKAASEFQTGSENRVNRADANAAKPADNAMAQLAARLAEIRGKITGGDTELAHWNALITQQPEKYAAAAAQIKQYAASIDEANRQLKVMREDTQALRNIENRKDKSQESLELEKQYFLSGKILDINKEMIDFQTKQKLDLNKVAAGDKIKLAVDPTATPDLPKAQAKADAADATEWERLLLNRVNANMSAEQTIRRSFDDTLAARRAAGIEEINLEKSQLTQDINDHIDNEELKRKLIDETTSYYAAKLEEVNRKTENALEKQGREWSDTVDQITSFEAQGMSGLVDNLTSQLTTGKAKWTDYANWAIQELTRMQMKAALSPLNSLLSSATKALGGYISDGVGSLFGGGGGAGGVAPPTAVEGDFFAYHSGGMVGSESSFLKNLPSALFSNAPKFHSGAYLQSDEVPAILQKGEAVFTAGQLGALGNLNYNYEFVQNALQALVDAANQFTAVPQAPANVAPAPLYNAPAGASGGAGRGMPVTLNVQNQTPSPVNVTAATPRFDAQQMVLDIVVRNVQQPGALRNAILGVK